MNRETCCHDNTYQGVECIVHGDGRPDGFWFGEWLVEPSLNQLLLGDKVVHLRPKVMDVLAFLASHPGQVVSKEDIVAGVWAKKFLADTALSRAIFELREALGDDPHKPRYVETIAKRGYRLVAPLRPVADPAPEEGIEGDPPGQRSFWWVAGVLGGTLVVIAIVVRLLLGSSVQPASATSTRVQRLAVVPFETLGPARDPAFAALLAEQIAAHLAESPDLVVVFGDAARTGAPGVDGASPFQAQGVAYVLSGTVRWDEVAGERGRVRVIPRLVRAGGTYQWAEVFDRVVGDEKATREDMAASVAHKVEVVLRQGGRSATTAVPSTNPDAYEAYLRGMQYMRQVEGAEGQKLAVRMLERAVEHDPGFTWAWAELVRANGRLYHFGFDRTAARQQATRAALDQIVRLAPDDWATHVALAYYALHVDLDSERAIDEAVRADERGAPRHVTSSLRGCALRRLGRLPEAYAALQEALENTPNDAWAYCEVGITAMMLREFEDADRLLALAVELAPDQHTAYEWRSLNYLLWRGSRSRARAELERMPSLARAPVALAWWRQEILEGRPTAALERLSDLPSDICALQFEFFPRELLEAQAYDLAGDRVKAREAYTRAARVLEREQSSHPEDPRIPSALGLALAGLGRRGEALEAGERALTMSLTWNDTIRAGFARVWIAQIHLMTGDVDAAARLVREVLDGPVHPAAVPLLWLDPRWAPLRTHPLLQNVTLGRPS